MSRINGRDVLVLLKVAANRENRRSMRSLAEELGLSASSVSDSVKRLREAGLLGASPGTKVNRIATREFLIHGLRWVVPGSLAGVELGLPTADAAAPLREKLMGPQDFVMPLTGGPSRGVAVAPIDESAPKAAQRDPKLHLLLALADAMRVGSARSKELAASEIRAFL